MENVKYPSIPYLELDDSILKNPVMVFEKLDGGNCQVRCTKGEKLDLATRSGDYSNRTRQHEWFGEFQDWAYAFYISQQHVWKASLQELLPSHLVLFGEWLSFHSIQYTPEKMNEFYLIDVYDTKQQRFLPYPEGARVATIDGLIKLNTLTPLYEGPASVELLENILAKPSEYREGNKEGIVIKDYANQRFAKLLHPEYSEIFRNKGGLDAYLTPRRLEKVAQKINVIGKEPLNVGTLQRAFIADLKKEAPPGLVDNKIINKWLEANMGSVLKKYARKNTKSI